MDKAKLKQLEKDPLILKIKASILKEKALLAKYGVDLPKFWKDLQASPKK